MTNSLDSVSLGIFLSTVVETGNKQDDDKLDLSLYDLVNTLNSFVAIEQKMQGLSQIIVKFQMESGNSGNNGNISNHIDKIIKEFVAVSKQFFQMYLNVFPDNEQENIWESSKGIDEIVKEIKENKRDKDTGDALLLSSVNCLIQCELLVNLLKNIDIKENSTVNKNGFVVTLLRKKWNNLSNNEKGFEVMFEKAVNYIKPSALALELVKNVEQLLE